MSEVCYFVEGINPEPWEAPTASLGRKGGKHYVHMHKNDGLRSYQEGFKQAFLEQNPDWQYFDTPIEIEFYFWRQRDYTESRAAIADVTNLQKATEDALQGVLYPNDQLVHKATSWIVEQDQETSPKVLIFVRYYNQPDRSILELVEKLHKEPAPPQDNIRVIPDVF